MVDVFVYLKGLLYFNAKRFYRVETWIQLTENLNRAYESFKLSKGCWILW